MDLSIFYAQLFGLYFLIVGVLVIAKHKVLPELARSFAQKTAILYFAGTFTLLLGLALVLSHNIWEYSWKGVITVIVWLTLIKGI
ncbi:MAG: hypothetical protein QF679_02760, partial [Candidatus Pacebacteria bacterium]|nr:hypothetical protein [Candidatus Paceibacterota bacterium]